MNDDISGGTSKGEPQTDWDRVHRMTDDQVHGEVARDPEIRPTDEAFWQDAHVVLPKRKEAVTIRLDADLLVWLRRERGYQTRINAVLRAYMDAAKRSGRTA
jgi:uncharacterized protein (DUF4415 family)